VRLAQRKRQIDLMARQLQSRGGNVPSRAQLLSTLLVIEVMCDAIADGDVKTLGIREAEMVDILAEHLRQPMR
jgi:hypothetical protein